MSIVNPIPVLSAKKRTIPVVPTISLEEALLNGKKMRISILDVILGGSERRTVEGASELRLDCADPGGKLLTSEIFGEGTTLEIDNVEYAFVRYSKSGNRRLSLTFEDANVAKLRTYTKPRQVYRGKVTRPDFAEMLVREARNIGFFTLDVAKPSKAVEETKEAAEPEKTVPDEEVRGFAPGEKVTVKGATATSEQRKNMSAVLDYGYQRGYPKKVLVAAVATIIVESESRNLSSGHLDSQGLFQQRPSQGWGSVTQVRDIEHASGKFYSAAMSIYRKSPNISVGELSQSVQRSGRPLEYGKRTPEAEKNVAYYLGGEYAGDDKQDDKTVKRKRYAFSRGKPGGPAGEDTWSALQRLAQEVGWRCFMVGRTVWFLSEIDLFSMKPVDTIYPYSAGLEDVNFDYDAGKPVAEASISIRLGSWRGGPGSIINLDGFGPADGRWLVVEMERSMFSLTASVKLRKPDPKLPEPLGEPIQEKPSSGSPSSSGGDSGEDAAGGSSTFNGKFIWPTKSHAITSHFGDARPGGRLHAGIDIGEPPGGQIRAAAAGKVTSAGSQQGYGNTVTIQHNGTFSTLYAHLNSYDCKSGDRLSAGDPVGKCGNTGIGSGPHLHFEIRNPSATDALKFLS